MKHDITIHQIAWQKCLMNQKMDFGNTTVRRFVQSLQDEFVVALDLRREITERVCGITLMASAELLDFPHISVS